MNTFDLVGAAFIIIVGCLAHFLYDWTKHNKLVGFLTAVNESTWEHMKLILAPSFIWLIAEGHFYGTDGNVFLAHFAGLITALVFIPAFFYSYKSILKRSILAIDILSFMVAAHLEQFVFSLVMQNLDLSAHPEFQPICFHVGVIGLVLIFLYYLTHTFAPQKTFLTRDPVTHKYGLSAHDDKAYKKAIKASHKPRKKKPQKKH